MMNIFKKGGSHLVKLLFIISLLVAFRDARPMYIIDEVESTEADMKKLDPHDIDMINVLKDASATATFGSGAADGVVMIYTKGYIIKHIVRLKNGKLIPMKDDVKVVTGKPSASVSSAPAVVIVRDTLKHPDTVYPATGYPSALVMPGHDSAGQTIRIVCPAGSAAEPLIIVDSVETSSGHMNKLDPNSIGSIQVFKGKEAHSRYGKQGKNGVIVVKLKEGNVLSDSTGNKQ